MNQTSFILILCCMALPVHAADSKKAPTKVPPSPPKVVQDLIQTFSSMDLDGNGSLDFGEFTANLRVMKGAAERIFRNVDHNRNRSVSLGEFANSRWVRLPAGTVAPIDSVKQEFRRLDGDGSGDISIEEIAIAMTFSNGDALDSYFAGLDQDQSGGIDLAEWRKGSLKISVGRCPGENATAYIGKSLDEVRTLLGDSFRVMRLDGVGFGGIANYDPCRLNLIVEKGMITGAYGG